MKIKNNDLFVFAMESEANSILKEVEYKIIDKKVNLYKANLEDKEFYIIITNVGLFNTIYKLTYIFSKYIINNVYNIGICGAFGYLIYDVVSINKTYFMDFDLTYFNYPKYQIPGEKVFIEIDYDKKFKSGSLFSSSKFEDKKRTKENKYLVDMEGAGVSFTCQKFNKNLKIYKVVSDLIESDTQKENYKDVESKCSKIIYEKIIKEVFICVD